MFIQKPKMGIFTSKYQRVLCKEVTLRDEAWALICAAKKRFESLCAKDSPMTDKAAETIAQLVLDIMESNTSGKETKTIQCAYVGVLRYGQNQFELHYDRDDYDTGEPM